MQGFTHTHCTTCFSPDKLISIFFYKGLIKETLKQIKYKTAVLGLVPDLCDFVEDYMEKYQVYIPSDFVWVPIPLHGITLLDRTYNQAELISMELSKRLGHKMVTNFLTRVRDTKSQTKLNLKERRENVKKASLCLKR